MPDRDPSSLAPDPLVQRVLISGACQFSGEYAAPGVSLHHASPRPRADGRPTAGWGPGTRGAFVLSFLAPVPDRAAGVVIPEYDAGGDHLVMLMALLYGKRFDAHGALVNCGFFGLPDLESFHRPIDRRLPFHSDKPRRDLPCELSLAHIGRFAPMFAYEGEPDAAMAASMTAFIAAGKAYLRAVQICEDDPENAYLGLITAGEIISNQLMADKDVPLDEEMLKLVERVRELPDSDGLVASIRRRLFQVKRKFLDAICGLIEQSFYSGSDSEREFGKLQEVDLRRRLGCAYDLRSQYVHSGASFGPWIHPSRTGCDEVQLGRLNVRGGAFAKALALAPTLIGLERIMRHALLQFATRRGLLLPEPPSPQPPPLPPNQGNEA